MRPMPPVIPLDGFSSATRSFIARVIVHKWGLSMSIRPKAVSFEVAAALFFILRDMDDADFPGGKWATIQHLESLLNERTT